MSAATMMIGLMRWPSLHWQLALAHADAAPALRDAIAVMLAASNSVLGNVIGEFLGELFLNLFFVSASWAMVRAGGGTARWWFAAGAGASLLGAVAMLRNAVDWVQPIAALNNVVLPLWMLAFGVVLLRHGWRLPGALQDRSLDTQALCS